MEPAKTKFGEFRQDLSGLWHYGVLCWAGDVWKAAEDALANKPEGVCWFWFNGTPAPMVADDSVAVLVCRWGAVRNAYKTEETEELMGWWRRFALNPEGLPD
ncbi:MAG: hypothetical protein Q8L24_02725 [bacterium]|nr:hypothetical protein [bacterium]